MKLLRSLVISIFLYACESWTLTAELEKRTQAFEMRCYRRLLNISYKDHVTNEEVRRKIQAAIGISTDIFAVYLSIYLSIYLPLRLNRGGRQTGSGKPSVEGG